MQLRLDKRPRPLTLRMNVGDCLQITLTNLLSASPTVHEPAEPGDAEHPPAPARNTFGEQPSTRTASVHVVGLQLVNSIASDGSNVGYNPSSLVPPGYRDLHLLWRARRRLPDVQHRGRGAVDITPLAERLELRADGENVLRFRLNDMYTSEPRTELKDVAFILTATNGWRQRGPARHVGDGVYELKVSVPAAGVYYMSFEIPSIGLRFSDRAPVIWRSRVEGRGLRVEQRKRAGA